MKTSEETIEIRADSEAIFDLTHDYGQRLCWDPFLRDARLLGNAKIAGAQVGSRCAAKWRLGGWAMDTIYVSFRRPHVAAVKMIRGPWFITNFAASLRHESTSFGTRVAYRFHVECFPRFLKPVVMCVLSRETRGRLIALKQHMEAV